MKPDTPPEADILWEPERNARAEIKIKRSLFIGQSFPCRSAADVRQALAEAESAHRGANHNCWAYCIADGNPEPAEIDRPEASGPDTSHSSDDGEPAGTAGRPILSAIRQSGMTNVMVVVTRYFGGIKLGVRGLIEAYGQAAAEAIALTPRARRIRTRRLAVRFPCGSAGDVTRLVDVHGGTSLAWSYDADGQTAEAEVEADFRLSAMTRAAAALDELLAKKRIRSWAWLRSGNN